MNIHTHIHIGWVQTQMEQKGRRSHVLVTFWNHEESALLLLLGCYRRGKGGGGDGGLPSPTVLVRFLDVCLLLYLLCKTSIQQTSQNFGTRGIFLLLCYMLCVCV